SGARVRLASERSAAWLAHQSGGLGVASSNLAAPTIKSRTWAVAKTPLVREEYPPAPMRLQAVFGPLSVLSRELHGSPPPHRLRRAQDARKRWPLWAPPPPCGLSASGPSRGAKGVRRGPSGG